MTLLKTVIDVTTLRKHGMSCNKQTKELIIQKWYAFKSYEVILKNYIYIFTEDLRLLCQSIGHIYNLMKKYREKIKETCVLEKIIRLLQKKFYYVVVLIEKSQNIGVLTIQGFMGKLSLQKRSKMAIDIDNEVDDVDKVEEDK